MKHPSPSPVPHEEFHQELCTDPVYAASYAASVPGFELAAAVIRAAETAGISRRRLSLAAGVPLHWLNRFWNLDPIPEAMVALICVELKDELGAQGYDFSRCMERVSKRAAPAPTNAKTPKRLPGDSGDRPAAKVVFRRTGAETRADVERPTVKSVR